MQTQYSLPLQWWFAPPWGLELFQPSQAGVAYPRIPFPFDSGLTLAMCNILLQVSKKQVKMPPPSFYTLNVARQRGHSRLLLRTCLLSIPLAGAAMCRTAAPTRLSSAYLSPGPGASSAVGGASGSPAGPCSIGIGGGDTCSFQFVLALALSSSPFPLLALLTRRNFHLTVDAGATACTGGSSSSLTA